MLRKYGDINREHRPLVCRLYIAFKQLGEAIASFNFSIGAYVKHYWFPGNFYLQGSNFYDLKYSNTSPISSMRKYCRLSRTLGNRLFPELRAKTRTFISIRLFLWDMSFRRRGLEHRVKSSRSFTAANIQFASCEGTPWMEHAGGGTSDTHTVCSPECYLCCSHMSGHTDSCWQMNERLGLRTSRCTFSQASLPGNVRFKAACLKMIHVKHQDLGSFAWTGNWD